MASIDAGSRASMGGLPSIGGTPRDPMSAADILA